MIGLKIFNFEFFIINNNNFDCYKDFLIFLKYYEKSFLVIFYYLYVIF